MAVSPLDLSIVVVRESIASVRSALWPLAMLRPLPRAVRSDRHPVVLVHGYLGHREMFRPLERKLRHAGFGCIRRVGYPSTQSGPEDIVRAIAEAVEPLAESGPVDLVGHSLGAVACRAYLKLFGGARYVRRFVSLGGPHGGTVLYRLTPRPLWPVLNPDGPWVRKLAGTPEPVPTVVIRARYDHQVLAPRPARLGGATEVVLPRYGHNGLLWSSRAHQAVIAALQ